MLGALHGLAIRWQLALVLSLVPIVAALHGVWIAPLVVDVAMADATLQARAHAVLAARVAVVVTVALVAIASAAAAMLLRGSIRTVVDQLAAATRAIAAGELGYRVDSRRRDELGQLAGAIDSMAERLQRLEQARRRVLACVSHELRTPLTIMQGHAFTLARDEPCALRRDRLELVQSEAMHLARLVDDLVDASSAHAGGLRLARERCDLVDVVARQLERHQVVAADRGVELRASIRSQRIDADVDPVRIAQVVDNLLANAIRHAPAGTQVAVRLAITRRGDRVLVVDNRCDPIATRVLDSMFEPFAQGGDGRSGSLGLGLAIVAAIAEAHGGSVRVDRQRAALGQARLTVTLPAPIVAPSPARAAGTRRGIHAVRIAGA